MSHASYEDNSGTDQMQCQRLKARVASVNCIHPNYNAF